jgi:hypothetical protein
MKSTIQFSVMIGFMSKTTTVTFLTARVLARSSPMPEAPPVRTTICSPQSKRDGANIKLPWFRYNREYHLTNPAMKY